MRGPAGDGPGDDSRYDTAVVDLTGQGPGQSCAEGQGAEGRGSSKRKFTPVDEEHRVIGRLKRVQLMEGGGVRPKVEAEVVVLDHASHSGEEHPVPGQEEGEGGCAPEKQHVAAPWYLDDMTSSAYADMNRMLGDAHREMLERRGAG